MNSIKRYDEYVSFDDMAFEFVDAFQSMIKENEKLDEVDLNVSQTYES